MVTKNVCGGYNLRKAFGILILVASISLIVFQPVQAKSEKSKTLFSDNFSENNLNNWSVNTSGNADAIADNGTVRLRVYKCSNVLVSHNIGKVNGNITIDFDWDILSEGWWEGATWKLLVNDKPVVDYVFMGSAYGNIAGHVTQDLKVKGDTVLQYAIDPSPYCSNGDHYNTYYWIDNITVKKP